jgi:hypothetical protein
MTFRRMQGPGWLLVLVVAAASGCWGLARPNWCDPGPARYQQMRAVRFDPYTDNELGPPVVGGRPLGYQDPLPEVPGR